MFDSIWNIVFKKDKRYADEVKTNKKENFNKYLKELEKIVFEDNTVLSNVSRAMWATDSEIRDMLRLISKTLRKTITLNKNGQKSLENELGKCVNKIIKSIKKIASDLTFE